jgi:carbamoylphosphate synthase large subunit
MKRLLLLGGSTKQIPAIEYAKKQGYNITLCDYFPDNPGQNYADKFYCVSTTDREAILEVAQKENVDGVVAYASDPAAPTAAYVAEKMGLPTSPYKSVELLINKDKFRAFLAEHNFCTPRANGYSSIEEAKKDIERLRVSVLIKLLKYSYKEQWKDVMSCYCF